MSLKKRIALFLLLLKCNPIKTIWINFKMLPIKQAIYLPIFLYGRTTFRSLKGQIKIMGTIETGMIKIGNNTCYTNTVLSVTTWTIDGTLLLKGPISFLQGTYVLIAKNALLEIGSNGTFIGSDSKIIYFENILIGNNVWITWENQIIDTSFHYIKNEKFDCKPLTRPIFIGNNIWIGNRCTISKGTVLSDFSIVASNSLLNKDYSDSGCNVLLAGCPAIIKDKGVKHIFNEREESILDLKWGYNRTKL